MLGLVEPVDLVDENDGRLSVELLVVLGLGHHVLDFLDAGQDGAEDDARHVEMPGEHHAQGRFSRTRRTPEDQRDQPPRFDELGQDPPRSEQVCLSVELAERPGPKALGERRGVGEFCGMTDTSRINF